MRDPKLELNSYRRVAVSHTATIESSCADTSRLPSGLNATLRDSSVLRIIAPVGIPVPASHSLTEPS
jgi:hypothetical protein